MENNIIFINGTMEQKVPINNEVYRTNLEYYSGMGIYSDDLCKEKALLISGYRVVKSYDINNPY